MPKTKHYRVIDLSRLAPGMQECTVEGCEWPRGRRSLGFTPKGLSIHKKRLHSAVPVDPYDSMKGGVSDADEFAAPVDFGTPGDEVVMGPALSLGGNQRLIDDIKDVVSHDDQGQMSNWVTPAHDEDEEGAYVRGWWVRGRNACCRWTNEGHEHTKDFVCKGYFVANPNLTEALHRRLYDRPKPERQPHEPPRRNRPATQSAPVEPLDNEGVRVKARKGILYVDGQPANLDNFIDGLRLAVRMS